MLRDISRSCVAAECDRCGVISRSVMHYEIDCGDALQILEHDGWLIDVGDDDSAMMSICPECAHMWSMAVMEWKRRMKRSEDGNHQ